MTGKYEPTVTEGQYPEDGGWTENILLLSIPKFHDVIQVEVEKFDYAWLYNKEVDAYIFCFRFSNEAERAIIFHVKHAGQLLMEPQAFETFSIAITSKAFEEMTDDTPYLYLPDIRLTRQSIAGW